MRNAPIQTRKNGAAVRLRTLAAACLLAVVAGDALGSEWTAREFARFRLLAANGVGGPPDRLLAALEVELKPGWQFYHAEPGRFGVAPTFDWSTSRNLKDAKLHWPPPTRYRYTDDPPVWTLGYKDALLLPVTLRLIDEEAESGIRLILEYAVCEAYCVIDTVELALPLPAGDTHTRRILGAFEAVRRHGKLDP